MAGGICRLDLALPDLVRGRGGIETGHLRHRVDVEPAVALDADVEPLVLTARDRDSIAQLPLQIPGPRGPLGFLGQGGVLQGPVSNDGCIPRLHTGMGDVRHGRKLHRGHNRTIAARPRLVQLHGRTLLHRRAAPRDGHLRAGPPVQCGTANSARASVGSGFHRRFARPSARATPSSPCASRTSAPCRSP